jgi:hypothetical protein
VGDTLVLPCNAGGCDRFGWAPRSLVPVTDVGDDARRVRLHPAVHPELSPDIAALLGTEATASDWQRLALRAGLTQPGRVIAIPGGSVVLCRQAWTSESALRAVTLPVHVQAVAAHVLRLAQALFRPRKVRFPCSSCGLQRHDPDAVHCKACGVVLAIPDEGRD